MISWFMWEMLIVAGASSALLGGILFCFYLWYRYCSSISEEDEAHSDVDWDSDIVQGIVDVLAPLSEEQQEYARVQTSKSGLLADSRFLDRLLDKASPYKERIEFDEDQMTVLLLRCVFGALRVAGAVPATTVLSILADPSPLTSPVQLAKLTMMAIANVTPSDAPLSKRALLDSILAAGATERAYIELLWRVADLEATGDISCNQFVLACLEPECPDLLQRREQSFEALADGGPCISHAQLSLWLSIGLASAMEVDRRAIKMELGTTTAHPGAWNQNGAEAVSQSNFALRLAAFSYHHRQAVTQVRQQCSASLDEDAIKRGRLKLIADEVESCLSQKYGVESAVGWTKAEFLRLQEAEVLDVSVPEALIRSLVSPRWLVEKREFIQQKLKDLQESNTHDKPQDTQNSTMFGWFPKMLFPSKL